MNDQTIIENYLAHLKNKQFPCIGAKASLAKNQVRCFVARDLSCPADDLSILEFLYNFIDEYRQSEEMFYSAAVLFKGPQVVSEEMFEQLFWKRLQAISDLDAQKFPYDNRVDPDPASAKFSFSLKEESSFIIGLHPASSRESRKFEFPALVFNPHASFEKLRQSGIYEPMKHTIRKREIPYSGSVNPMVKDFGDKSEVFQYSGRQNSADWQCPFKPKHGNL